MRRLDVPVGLWAERCTDRCILGSWLGICSRRRSRGLSTSRPCFVGLSLSGVADRARCTPKVRHAAQTLVLAAYRAPTVGGTRELAPAASARRSSRPACRASDRRRSRSSRRPRSLPSAQTLARTRKVVPQQEARGIIPCAGAPSSRGRAERGGPVARLRRARGNTRPRTRAPLAQARRSRELRHLDAAIILARG